jgi:hypothetical protein
MIKFMVAAMVFLGMGAPCFSELKAKIEFEGEDAPWAYIGLGNGCVLLKDFSGAVEHFGKATALLNASEALGSEGRFLICFGEAIAHDCLGHRHEAEAAINALILMAEKTGEGGGEEALSEEDRVLLRTMKEMAMMAPSDDIRSFLVELVMLEE